MSFSYRIVNGEFQVIGECTEIPAGTCSGLDEVMRVVIPSGVIKIGAQAFALCPNLVMVHLSDTVEEIGEQAFGGSPASVLFYYSGTAEAWEKVRKSSTWNYTVRCNDKHVKAADALHISHSELVSRSEMFVHEEAPTYDPATHTITLSENVLQVDITAEPFTLPVQRVVVAGSNSIYKSIDDILYTTTGVLCYCPRERVRAVNVPEGVKEIAEAAFKGCLLHRVSLPQSLHTIGSSAFANSCLKEITVPDSVTSIGPRAFAYCFYLEKAVLSATLKCVSAGMFLGCLDLREVRLPASAVQYEREVFSDCKRLTDVEVTGTCEWLPEKLFSDCEALVSIHLPASIHLIRRYALYTCRKLIHVYFDGTVSQWEGIEKEERWHAHTGHFIVHCADGDMPEVPSTALERKSLTTADLHTRSLEILHARQRIDHYIDALAHETSSEKVEEFYAKTLEWVGELRTAALSRINFANQKES